MIIATIIGGFNLWEAYESYSFSISYHNTPLCQCYISDLSHSNYDV